MSGQPSPQIHLYDPNGRVSCVTFQLDQTNPSVVRATRGSDMSTEGVPVLVLPPVISNAMATEGPNRQATGKGDCYVCQNRKELTRFFRDQMSRRQADVHASGVEMFANVFAWGVPVCDRCHRDGEEEFRVYVRNAASFTPRDPNDGCASAVCCCFCSLCCAMSCGTVGAALTAPTTNPACMVGGTGLGVVAGCYAGAKAGRYTGRRLSALGKCVTQLVCARCRR